MTALSTLQLHAFRSYTELEIKNIGAGHVILCGANGAGKTNILEALSLLAPGRGLRGAKAAEIQKKSVLQPWSVSVVLDTHYGAVQIGVGHVAAIDKKVIRINGDTAKNQAALGEWLSCLWLTPQMDRLFIDEKSARRKFFDRLIYTFDPGHMGRLTRYENAMRQRHKLFRDGLNDAPWFAAIEAQMAETAAAICAARTGFCDKLQQAYEKATDDERAHFPAAFLTINGDIEARLQHESALQVEEYMKKTLAQGRARDRENVTTGIGPHRSDFLVEYADKKIMAAQSSTGEQKALLIGIILAHARLLKEDRGQAPLLLLDEIVAHLDPGRRQVLAHLLKDYTSQVWMTGTDAALFESFHAHSTMYEVRESSLHVVSR